MTIYALSSGPGISGIAVIRVSGAKAKDILKLITNGKFPKERVATLKKIIMPLFIVSFIFLALVPFFGIEVKGAKRWLDFYFFRLQPIEILKPFFIWRLKL